MGVVTAAKMNPYECRFTLPGGTHGEGLLLLMAVGNGRQCGGGYQVTPDPDSHIRRFARGNGPETG